MRFLAKPARFLYKGAKIAAPVIFTGLLSRKVINSLSSPRRRSRESFDPIIPPISQSALLSGLVPSFGSLQRKLNSRDGLGSISRMGSTIFASSSSPFSRKDDEILDTSQASPSSKTNFLYGDLDDTWLDKFIAGLCHNLGSMFGGTAY